MMCVKVECPSQVKGVRLKLCCVTLRGFKSRLYHLVVNIVAEHAVQWGGRLCGWHTLVS